MPNLGSGQQNGKVNCRKVGNDVLPHLLALTRPAANGEPFHFSFIRFFRLYTSLFLNSFGVQDHVSQVRNQPFTYFSHAEFVCDRQTALAVICGHCQHVSTTP